MLVTMILGGIACVISSRSRSDSLITELDSYYTLLENEYTETLDNFWQVYMPLFENNYNGLIYNTLYSYFTKRPAESLKPLERKSLNSALLEMSARNDQIRWIAVYDPDRSINYIVSSIDGTITTLDESFPYWNELQEYSPVMELYSAKTIVLSESSFRTYAISGGLPSNWGHGKILVGYSLSNYEQIIESAKKILSDLRCYITYDHQLLFDSSHEYSDLVPDYPISSSWDRLKGPDGTFLCRSQSHGNNASRVIGCLPYSYFLQYTHRYTPMILWISLGFILLSITLYLIMLRLINQEVNYIWTGLREIGQNHLDYRILEHFHQLELKQIALSINRMAQNLKENQMRTYEYEQRQKEAELAEMQAKFNPHFLYNSLEMLRSRCYQSGDDEMAEMITQLSALFRGFITSRTFIPLSEELSFSKRYLSLFQARYDNQIRVLFNIDTELLQYGIIRNVFQPLIENYFIHGYQADSSEDNYIRISGKSLDAKHMLLSVEDNGSGITKERLSQLNQLLSEAAEKDSTSFGLKNLNQRIRLFYGNSCGLSIHENETQGVIIQMRLLKITCEEYEAAHKNGSHVIV